MQTYSYPRNESPAWDAWRGLSAAVVGLALILVLVRLPFLFINTPAQASRISAYFFLGAFIDLLYLGFLLIYIFRHYRRRRSLWLGLAFLLSLASLFLPKFRQLRARQREVARMEEQYRAREEAYQQLIQKEERFATDPRFVERVAREELGKAKPGEIIFRFSETNAG